MDSTDGATLLILAFASFVPAVVFLAWIRSGARGRKEPWVQLSIAFLYGAIVAVVIAIILEIVAASLLSMSIVREYDIFGRDPSTITFLMVVVIAPFVEEFAKLFGLFRVSGFVDHPRSGLVFGAAVGLGFAATENMLYEGSALLTGGVVLFLTTALVRSFSSALMHGSATSMSGYGLGRSKFGGKSWFPFYLLAVLMHGAFNLFASFGGLFESELGSIASIVGLAFAFILVIVSVRIVRAKMRS
ncbi:MAG: PrsW family intramembrane metalloprotease [Methanomassiliicoccales archaeon]|nr:PrsW family intramembrane metalloprotease [Methanomassiliicoccales archaeon]